LAHHSGTTKKQRTMSEFKFSCPHCQQHLKCEEQFSGREIQCPGCNHLIRIPSIPGRTVEYKPESGKTWATFVPAGNAPPPKLSVSPKKEPPKPS
jgi:hypothetical protein